MAPPQATDDADTIFQRMVDNNQADYNWMIVEVNSDDTAKCIKTGLGIDDLRQSFQDDKIQWALLIVRAVDRSESVRTKVVQVTWVGRKVPRMKKMNEHAGKATIGSLAKGLNVTIKCNHGDDLDMVSVARALLNAGGAQKPAHYDFGGNCSISVTELGLHE